MSIDLHPERIGKPRIPDRHFHGPHDTEKDKKVNEMDADLVDPYYDDGIEDYDYDEIDYDLPKETCWLDMLTRQEGQRPCRHGYEAVLEGGRGKASYGCYKKC